MTIVEAAKLLQTYLLANWVSTPLAFHNVDDREFAEVGQPILPTGTEDYVTIRTHVYRSQLITVPGHCRRYFGNLYLALSTRKGEGTRGLEGMMDQLISLLEGKTLRDDDDNLLRVWTLIGNAEYTVDDWLVSEVAFGFSFERFTLT